MPVAAIGIGLAAIGTVASVVGGIEGASAASRAAKAREQQQAIQAQQQRMEQVRQARIKAAAITAAANNQGVSDSSGAMGGEQGINANLAANTSFIDQQVQAGMALSKAQNAQASAQGVESIGSGISKIGGTVFNNRNEISSAYNDVFG